MLADAEIGEQPSKLYRGSHDETSWKRRGYPDDLAPAIAGDPRPRFPEWIVMVGPVETRLVVVRVDIAAQHINQQVAVCVEVSVTNLDGHGSPLLMMPEAERGRQRSREEPGRVWCEPLSRVVD
jgi:hypothetical protein